MSKNKGIYFALITAFISGVSIFINKFAVEAIKQPLVFTSVKNTAVAIILLEVLLFSRKWIQIKKLSRRELVYLFLIGLIGGSIPFYLFFTGLSKISAVNGAIIQKTLVFWVALLAIPFLKERLSFMGTLGVLILFASNFIVGGFKGFAFSNGELLVLLATVLWSVEIILAKKVLSKVDPDILTGARMGIGSIILLAMSAILQPASFSKSLNLNPTQLTWVALTAIMLFFYVATWYRALKFAPAITVTSILVSSVLITNLLSAIFVTHNLNLLVLIQSLMMALGVFVLYKAEKFASKNSSVRAIFERS